MNLVLHINFDIYVLFAYLLFEYNKGLAVWVKQIQVNFNMYWLFWLQILVSDGRNRVEVWPYEVGVHKGGMGRSLAKVDIGGHEEGGENAIISWTSFYHVSCIHWSGHLPASFHIAIYAVEMCPSVCLSITLAAVPAIKHSTLSQG